jgi:hypothetical protein
VTLPVIFHELAENELNEAAAYYAHARPGLGEAFVAEVQRAVEAKPRHITAAHTRMCWQTTARGRPSRL